MKCTLNIEKGSSRHASSARLGSPQKTGWKKTVSVNKVTITGRGKDDTPVVVIRWNALRIEITNRISEQMLGRILQVLSHA